MGIFEENGLNEAELQDLMGKMYHIARQEYGYEGDISFSVFWDLVLGNESLTLFRIFRGYRPMTGEEI